MAFDPKKSKIAITLGEFTLLRHSEGLFDRYNEPYIVSAAVDSGGKSKPSIDFSFMPFPKVRRGSTVSMLGDGHMLYGPKNPGEFVAISVFMMESDTDMRERGKIAKKILQSKAADLGVKALIAANPGAAAIVGILKELATFASGVLAQDGDDELFRIDGSFLRDHPVPYHINREYRHRNDFVEIVLRVHPLESSNGQGAEVERVML